MVFDTRNEIRQEKLNLDTNICDFSVDFKILLDTYDVLIFKHQKISEILILTAFCINILLFWSFKDHK